MRVNGWSIELHPKARVELRTPWLDWLKHEIHEAIQASARQDFRDQIQPDEFRDVIIGSLLDWIQTLKDGSFVERVPWFRAFLDQLHSRLEFSRLAPQGTFPVSYLLRKEILPKGSSKGPSAVGETGYVTITGMARMIARKKPGTEGRVRFVHFRAETSGMLKQ